MFNTFLSGLGINVTVANDKTFNDIQTERIRAIMEGNGVFNDGNINTINTVFTAKKILADTLSKLPMNVLLKNKQYQEHPLFYLVHSDPNSYQTMNVFISTLVNHLCDWGNAFAKVNKQEGKVKNLQILHPSQYITHDLNAEGVLKFKFRTKDGEIEVNNDDLIHLKILSDDGIIGLNPIAAIRKQLSINWQGQTTAENYYRNGIHGNKFMKSMGNVDSKEYHKGQQDWLKANSGVFRAGEVPSLPFGVEIQETKLEFADSMILDSLRYNTSQILALFGIPMWMNNLESQTNIEQSLLSFQSITIQPLAKCFKEEFSKKLLMPEERRKGITIEFNLKAMLAADAITRANYLKTLTSSAIISPGEAAEIEGYDGDFENSRFHYQQSQNIPLELSMVDGKWSPATAGSVNLMVNKNE
ncbi:MAG TPA: phage portal protein [Bacteroidales bacterium]|nr:phage portal protein [Bacteroidales bacterium]